MKIHPTAIVSSEAILGENVEVGPYAIIESGVKIGAHCIIQAHAVLIGHTTLGEKNFVGYGCILGAEPQDFSFQPTTISEVRIGNRNKLREYVTIHRGTQEGTATCVGDDNFLMSGVHLGHNCQVGNRTVMANNVLLAGYVEVEDAAILGGGTVFHQYIRVGRNVMARGGTHFSKSIPPYTLATEDALFGLNAIGLKRAGFASEVRQEIKRAFKLVYLSGLNITQALETAKEQEWSAEAQHFFNFIRASTKRGVCCYTRKTSLAKSEPLNS